MNPIRIFFPGLLAFLFGCALNVEAAPKNRWLQKSGYGSDSHNGFNELHLRSDVLTLCSDLCASVSDLFLLASNLAKCCGVLDRLSGKTTVLSLCPIEN